jgi:hypothetical protein|tara:strand:+ start:345 stop:638 length:294 start_codon:yes stop_codon:yes gene_type:complete
MSRVRVNIKQALGLFKDMDGLTETVIKQAYPYLKAQTPIQTGNARRNTNKRSNKIISNYHYASDLDAGKSRQAPRGFTEPTIEEMQRIVTSEIRKLD